MTGGIEIVRQTDSVRRALGRPHAHARAGSNWSPPSRWLTRSESDGGQTLVSWCDAKEIGIFSKAFQLGRLRAATPLDVQPPPLELNDYSLTSLERAYAGYTPPSKPQGKDRTLLVLKAQVQPASMKRAFLIDTARHVILSIEDRYKGKVTGTTKFDDFVEAAGSLVGPAHRDDRRDGKRLSLTTQTVKTLALGRAGATDEEGAGRPGPGAVPPPAGAERPGRQEGARRRQGEL